MISSRSPGEEWDWEVEATAVGRELLPPFLILDRPIPLVPNSLIGSKWGLWGKHIKSLTELKDIYVSERQDSGPKIMSFQVHNH